MVGGLAHERGVVSCPSYEARARGVETGTSLREASRLIPDGIFLRGDFYRYQYFSERFYDILNRFTPAVDRISQDEACLAIGGIIRQFGDLRTMAERLQTEIWETLSLSTSVGIGPGRVVAKIASEYQKPKGLTIVAKNNVENFLNPLPVGKIPGIGPVTQRILREMGIVTIGQLAAVPEEYLKNLFGINGLKIAAYSRGEDGPLLHDYKIVRSVSRETGFADDITDRNILLSHFYYLLERAAAKLRLLNKKASSLKLKFRYADFENIEGISRLTPPSNNEGQIYPLLEMMFTRMYTRRLGIRLVGIALTNLKSYADNATFLDDPIEKQTRLRKGLDDARRKAGFFSLMTGRTFSLSNLYNRSDTGYELRTPGLSQ